MHLLLERLPDICKHETLVQSCQSHASAVVYRTPIASYIFSIDKLAEAKKCHKIKHYTLLLISVFVHNIQKK